MIISHASKIKFIPRVLEFSDFPVLQSTIWRTSSVLTAIFLPWYHDNKLLVINRGIVHVYLTSQKRRKRDKFYFPCSQLIPHQLSVWEEPQHSNLDPASALFHGVDHYLDGSQLLSNGGKDPSKQSNCIRGRVFLISCMIGSNTEAVLHSCMIAIYLHESLPHLYIRLQM